MNEFAQVQVNSRAELRAWLTENAAQTQSIWLVRFKKPHPCYFPYDEVVEEVLCFGWIDSLPRKLDDLRTQLLLSPRRAGSGWSTVNKAKIARLVDQHLITARGLAAIRKAKLDGSWTLLDSAGQLELPSDLVAAFEAQPGSATCFGAFSASTRRATLEWVAQAKKPETRARRVAEIASFAAQNEKPPQFRPKAARAAKP
jgi:uncharacterized protein YdeI (YjbR/CyaY-like superfamily)